MIKWIGIGAVAVIAIVVAVFAYISLTGDDEPETTVATNLPLISASAVVADAIVLPTKSAELSMPSSGIVAAIFVVEGEQVKKDQPLARLVNDVQQQRVSQAEANLARATANLNSLEAAQAIAEADDNDIRAVEIAEFQLQIREAREHLAHVSGDNLAPGAVITPDGAIKEAARLAEIANARKALRNAQNDFLKALGIESTVAVPGSTVSVANASARENALANASRAVLNAQEELEDKQDIEKLFQDAQDDVTSAQNALGNARRDLESALLGQVEDARSAQDAMNDNEDTYRELFDKFLGIDLTDEELIQDPDALFDTWGVDLKDLFTRSKLALPDGRLLDDPETRWNELRIFAWVVLHPTSNPVDVRCNEVGGRLNDCLQADFQDTWDDFETSVNAFETTSVNTASAVTAARNTITSAERLLEDAQEGLDEFQTDRPQIDVAVSAALLSDALSDLNELEDFPDPVKVAEAEAAMAIAKATHDDLLDWPDPLQVRLASEKLAKLESELQKLERGRDPLVIAKEKAEVSAAEANITSLEASLALTLIDLDDMDLRAPFAGTVVSTEVDVGEEVAPETVVVRLADVSRWIIETDDLDELSVVNLGEGDRVTVTFDALPELEVTGSVVNINEFGEKKQGAITYTAEIELDTQDPRLRWNMTAAIKKEITNTGFSPETAGQAQTIQ